MEIREFFSDKEIDTMKERIIRETCLSRFLVKTSYTDSDGSKETYNAIEPELRKVIEIETVKQIKQYVKDVIDAVVKERASAAVDRFSKNLCDQLDKITEKTNWYWSIK